MTFRELESRIGELEMENAQLRAIVRLLERERDEAIVSHDHKAFLLDALRAAVAPTDENVRAYYRAQGQHGEARGQDVRDILAAIAARVEVAGGG